MQAIDVAEKWAKAANDVDYHKSCVTDETSLALVSRLRAHYGTADVLVTFEVYTVAMLEAMNEWQTIKALPVCVRCQQPIMPDEVATHDYAYRYVHALADQCGHLPLVASNASPRHAQSL